MSGQKNNLKYIKIGKKSSINDFFPIFIHKFLNFTGIAVSVYPSVVSC